MAIIYFTNNADNGDGSLRAAIMSAKDGDVIRPDETVFERGSTIEIALASQLNVDKNLTIDGRQFSITLNGSGKTTCVYVGKYVAARFIRVDFVNGVGGQELEGTTPGGLYVRDNSTVTAEQCRFVGCKGSSSGGFAVRPYAVLNIYDCLVAACCGNSSTVGAGASVARDGTLNAIGSTFIGNVGIRGDLSFYYASGNLVNAIVGKLYVSSQCSVEQTACVVDVKPSRLGFATPPPDIIAAADWTPELWKSWDLHLLDDGSDTPSPYRDAGDVEHMSRYDIEGNFRGRKTNGVATCSPGAYETIQADLFWIGKDADGNILEGVYFNDAVGWAKSRFADTTCDISPHEVKTIFMEGNLNLGFGSNFPELFEWLTGADESEFEGGNIVVGGNSIVKGWTHDFARANRLTIGARTMWSTTDHFFVASFRIGTGAIIDGMMISKREECSWADVDAIIGGIIATKYIPSNPLYYYIELYRTDDSVIQLDGEYHCYVFTVHNSRRELDDFFSGSVTEVDGEEFIVETSPGTTIYTRYFMAPLLYSCNEVFTNPVDVKLFGEAGV